jgi:hypothetical protein
VRVIVNSDILHTDRPLSTGLPTHLKEFFRHAGASAARIVVPRVALLEVEHHQESLVKGLEDRLVASADLLRAHAVGVAEFTPSAVVRRIGIVDAIRELNVAVDVEDATLDDYRDAESRAARHAPPADPATTSDEMRDLVIWATALRLARTFGGALLLSRDHVHSGPSGEAEANDAGLIRAKNHDVAAEVLGQNTPAGQLARNVLAVAWPALIQAGLPLPAEVKVQRLTALQFSADAAGHASGSLGVLVKSPSGTLSGHFELRQVGEGSVSIVGSRLAVDGVSWNQGTVDLHVAGQMPVVTTPIEKRLVALRGAIRIGP